MRRALALGAAWILLVGAAAPRPAEPPPPDLARLIPFGQAPSEKPATKTRFEMILGTKEHEMHHLGQLTVIERMLGIIPHITRANSDAEACEQKSE